MRIRGVVEPKNFTGGTVEKDHLQIGGSPVTDHYNLYQLKVSDPDSGLPNAEYTIDAEHCNPENWQNALNNYPLCDADGNSPLLSYNIYKQ